MKKLVTAFFVMGCSAAVCPVSMAADDGTGFDPFERRRDSVPTQLEAPKTPSVKEAPTSENAPREKFATFEMAATVDWFNKTSGGVPAVEDANGQLQEPESSAALGLLEFTAEIDTQKLGLWDNGTFFGNLIYTFGSSPDEFVGDFHGISSIDTGGISTTKLLEFWYEHNFDYSHSQILFGVQDFNADFYVLEYASVFISAAPGMGTVLGEATSAPAYPTTALGARLKVNLTPRLYVMGGIYDGTPGSEEDFFDPTVSFDEGAFAIFESAFHKGVPGDDDGYLKLGAGVWYLKKDLTEMAGLPEVNEAVDDSNNPYIDKNKALSSKRSGIGGAYIALESSIGKHAGVFFKMGRASASATRYPEFYAGGLTYTGLIPTRNNDVLGIVAMRTTQSNTFLSANPVAYFWTDPAQSPDSAPFFDSETVVEVTYAAQVTDWFMVQPDLQYIKQPGMSSFNGDAYVFGVRTQLVY